MNPAPLLNSNPFDSEPRAEAITPRWRINDASKNGIAWATALLLGISLFIFDLTVPLGMGNAPLYAIPVWLSPFLRDRRAPVLLGLYGTCLLVLGFRFSPVLPDLPPWFALPNRFFGIVLIWVSVCFKLERFRVQATLLRINDGLEIRVHERTRAMEESNRALQVEIQERQQIEQALRAREADLEKSQGSLRRSQQDLEQLAGELLTAQEAERRRIAHELHDDVNQRLALLAMDLRTVEQDESFQPASVRERVRSVLARTNQLSDDIRRLAYQFHPSILDDLGLPAALQYLVDDFEERTQIKTILVCEELVEPLPDGLASCLYRVAQEGLSNIAKHARASRAELELTVDEDRIELTIHDYGRGFERDHLEKGGTGMGLLNMQERIRAVHGAFELESTPGSGTRIAVTIPLGMRVRT